MTVEFPIQSKTMVAATAIIAAPAASVARDIQEKVAKAVPTYPVLLHRARDPVTDVEDLVYLIFKAEETAAAVASLLDNAEFLQACSVTANLEGSGSGADPSAFEPR